jgi:hypothetical protein
LSPAKIRKAAHTLADRQGARQRRKTGFEEAQQHNLYPMLRAPNEMGLMSVSPGQTRRCGGARLIRACFGQGHSTPTARNVLVATSEGKLSFDRQPMARMSVMVLARQRTASGMDTPGRRT